jgi:hypothetical protein
VFVVRYVSVYKMLYERRSPQAGRSIVLLLGVKGGADGKSKRPWVGVAVIYDTARRAEEPGAVNSSTPSLIVVKHNSIRHGKEIVATLLTNTWRVQLVLGSRPVWDFLRTGKFAWSLQFWVQYDHKAQ